MDPGGLEEHVQSDPGEVLVGEVVGDPAEARVRDRDAGGQGEHRGVERRRRVEGPEEAAVERPAQTVDGEEVDVPRQAGVDRRPQARVEAHSSPRRVKDRSRSPANHTEPIDTIAAAISA